jgi:Domain of unknown function (DUF5916)/Carbohydrate family 9 binding domain-like
MMFNFKNKNIVLSLILLFNATIYAQNDTRSIFVKYIEDKITLDGVLDEAAWQKANQIDDFWQHLPRDTVKSKNATEVKMFFDATTLYVSIKATAIGDDYVVSSLRRDFQGPASDNISVVFDPFCDGTNAVQFGANAYGVQRESMIINGGTNRDNFIPTWDVKWRSESKMYDKYFVLEMAIPFSSLKFKEGSQRWRFQSYRFDLQTNEQSSWVRVPQNQLLANLAFMGEMNFERPLGKSRAPIYVIPYTNGIASKDFTTTKASQNLTFGGDMKIGIGNGMNLDLTYNPDFSNIEVDNIITNLTRFEVSLPEKRQFFIDNNDLFGNYGSNLDEIPFFSRRIGLVSDTLGNSIQNRILGGMRLSGKLDENWRLGILNMQTADDVPAKIVSNNNAMISLQRKVFSRSNISAFMINRQTLQTYDFQKASDKFNRVLGLDYNLASKDGIWSGRFFAHKSFQPDDSKGNMSSQIWLSRNTRNYRFNFDLVYIDNDFRSDLGFVPRKGFLKQGNYMARNFYPKNSVFNVNTFSLLYFYYTNPAQNFRRTDGNLWLTWHPHFKDQSHIEVRYTNTFIRLDKAFDPTRTKDGKKLPANTGYYFNQLTTIFTSNNQRQLTGNATITVGEFYNGSIFSAAAAANLRFQPKAAISLNVNYDQIRLPAPYPSRNFVLIGPKVDITFSKSIFWSTLIQYSKQQDNLGVNSRLQWRFAPLSDLFLVYNDNYYTQDFGARYRSINLKLSYWLNVSSLGR